MSTDHSDADLRRFLDDVAGAEARSVRSRGRWTRQAVREEGTTRGLLRGLSEIRADVSVTTVLGTHHNGIVSAVGNDLLVVDSHSGLDDGVTSTLITLKGLSTIRATSADLYDDRGPTHNVRLTEVLAELAPAQPDIVAHAYGMSTGLAGRLLGVGSDLLVVAPYGDNQAHISIPAAAIVVIVLQ